MKTAEPIEVTFGIWTRVDPKNYAVSGVWTPGKGAFFWGGCGGLDGQHQDVDRTPCGRVNQNDRGQG